LPVLKIPAGQLADDERVQYDFSLLEEFPETGIPRLEMRNPDGCIDENHGTYRGDFLLGIGPRPVSVPASLASRLLLSRAISASNPSLTNWVFSLIPVSSEALFRISSLILIVVLICTYMHNFCICVKI
jgi:hypothetical protein